MKDKITEQEAVALGLDILRNLDTNLPQADYKINTGKEIKTLDTKLTDKEVALWGLLTTAPIAGIIYGLIKVFGEQSETNRQRQSTRLGNRVMGK